jgi:hypothetical protein
MRLPRRWNRDEMKLSLRTGMICIMEESERLRYFRLETKSLIG